MIDSGTQETSLGAGSGIEGFRLSPQQEHLWRLLREPGATPYRIVCEIHVLGRLDALALGVALQEVVARLEILRTSFRRLPGMALPLQVIDPEGGLRLVEHDLGDLDPEARQARLAALVDALLASPVDLERGPILAVDLVRLGPGEHAMLLALPALCADAASLGHLVAEIGRAYRARTTGEPSEGEPVQYADVSEILNHLLESEETEAGRARWRDLDLAALPVPRLPWNELAEGRTEPAPRALPMASDPGLAAAVEALAGRRGSSAAAVLLTVWWTLLARLSGEEGLVVAAAHDGRTYGELAEAVGPLARYAPVRAGLHGGLSFHEALARVDHALRETAELQDFFAWNGEEAERTLFPPVAFELLDLSSPFPAAPGLTFTVGAPRGWLERFRLLLRGVRRGGDLALAILYDAGAVAEAAVKDLPERLLTLLSAALAAPDTVLDELAMVGPRELHRLTVAGNATEADLGPARCLHRLVEEQADRSPDRLAVVAEEGNLSYAGLDARANRLARRLIRLGVERGDRVAVCLERGLDLVVGLLGILKVGAAYVPLDPAYPEDRLSYMVEESGARVLVRSAGLLPGLPYDGPVVCPEAADLETESAGRPDMPVAPDDLAYVIYTSGSTGRPKGVMIPHRAIVNRLLWMQSAFPLDAEDRVLQKTPFSFDASIWELFCPLLAGARLVMARPGGHQDPRYLVDAIGEQGVTVLQLVPSLLRVFLDDERVGDCRSLRRLFCGGEALPVDQMERFFPLLPGAALCNLYGPTESAIDATFWPARPGLRQAVAPIGGPLANVQVYVLDARLEPVPAGLPGELWIGGTGLAWGYLARPDLTAERFLPSPWSGESGARLYRTGDLVRHRPEGAIDFLGRIDHQVKIRGFRIELGEIEATLAGHPAVADVVVVAREGRAGDTRIVAYAVPRAGLVLPQEDLYELPNGLRIVPVSRSEADLIYREIFVDETYLQHGVTLAPGDCVVDVGANVGLFTLFAARRCPGGRIYSFEPVPPVFEKLRANVALGQAGATIFQAALSDHAGEAEITFYPLWSGMSGLYADAADDEAITRAFLRNQDERLAEHADELLAGRFEGEVFRCPLKTLSQVIRENGIEAIDLLKIDTEKSELDVLRGIEEQDWPKIGQIVIEAHDRDGHLEAITALLGRHGLSVVADDSGLLQGTGMVNLYAVSAAWQERRRSGAVQAPPPAARPAVPGAPPTAAELRGYLEQRLPDYMVPSAVVLLPELPRLPNGKVDRKSLPEPEQARPDQGADRAPATPTEEILVSLWAQVLGLEDLGVRDNFFDLGGHSLLATQLVSRIREVLAVDLRVRNLFEAPTVAGLAIEVEAARARRQGPSAPPIVPVPRAPGEPLPLSFAQQRLWFLHQLDEGSPAYNLSAGLRVRGSLRGDALARALGEIVRRHEALRTTFPLVDGAPAQVVGPPAPAIIPVADLSGLPAERREEEARRQGREEAARAFDLARGPLLRASLLRFGPEDHALLFTMHHIVGDGWSTGVLIRELAELYGAFAAGRPSPLPDLPIQYADFALWQRRWLEGEVLERQLSYWRERLGEGLETLDLPTDHPRPAIQSFRGARESFRLSPELAREVRALTRREGVSLFMTLLGAFATLLHRYGGQEDIPVGTPVASRNRLEIEGLIGVFINTLVMRVDLSGEPSFRDLLARVREVALGAYGHEDMPFERLVNELQPERDLARSPLFQAMLILQNAPIGAPELPGLGVELLPMESTVAKLDLTLEVAEVAGGLLGSLEHNTDLFERATIQRMAEHLEVLLAAAVAAPEEHLFDLPLLTGPERQQIVSGWNATAVELGPDRAVHDLFAERAAAQPGAVAVVHGEDRLTYGELDRRSGLVAAYLRQLGVGPGALVALSVERGLEMVVGLLGVLRAGGAYLPLDPAYPAARLELMLEDSGAPVLLTQERLRDRFAAPGLTVVSLDGDWPRIAAAGEDGPAAQAAVAPDDLAYVIYTSGSTGRPKGVMVSHRNAVSFFAGMDRRLGADPGCWLALTSISFDISVLELLWTLARGFQVVIQGERQPILEPAAAPAREARTIDFSLFYFANEEGEGRTDRYRLLLEGARFADRHGFAAVWTPERHFHAFGGLYPSPAVTSAAIATITERVAIRAGSVVLPLHQPIRVAEEWSMIDNLSRGRVGISFASGWHADDFVLAPESYAERKDVMLRGIETVRRLWRGEAVRARGGAGREVEVRILPRPLQPELPVWVTAAGNAETFRLAGEIRAGVLTHLLGQDLDDLERKIAVYRRAWSEGGRGPGGGHVTLMLHAFVGEDEETVRATVKGPFCNYLRASLDLVRNLSRGLGREIDPGALSPADLEEILERSFERYYQTSALLGTEEGCLRLVDRLKRAGVDEIACLIDFGIADETVLAGLSRLDALRRRANEARPAAPAAEELSLVAALGRYGVTHFQCTPTVAKVLAGDAAGRRALASLDHLLVGGEALPLSLLEQLGDERPRQLHNMYGPTETTVWSATWTAPSRARRIAIGRPIANTEIYVVDHALRPVPAGVPGELLIGGLGVTRGYLGRPDLTAERFVPDPFGPRAGGRLYRTGDLARFRIDGELEFLGRIDQQVKVHGYRIELEEIERALERHPGIAQAVVAAHEDAGNRHLVAYFVPARKDGTAGPEPWTGRYHRLPNGLRVACFNDFQASQAYREIFESAIYLRHGLALEDGDCVFDVGANIGFFSLFASQRCKDLAIYAFEPIPQTFHALQTNMELHGSPVALFPIGLGERAEAVRFTFYPQMPGLSGRYSDPERDRNVSRAILLAGLDREKARWGPALGDGEINDLLDEQFRSEIHRCQVRTLSEIIDEQGVEVIDLLKIDVERAELDVLRGLRADHWSRIRQIAMEVDGRENLEGVARLLGQQGFEVAVDELLHIPGDATGLVEIYMLYARRAGVRPPGVRGRVAAPRSTDPGLSTTDLRLHLRGILPDYMLPSAFFSVAALPLTPNGKVDRRRLPALGDRLRMQGKSVAPRNRIEKLLVEIWEKILPVEHVGIHDNFFELGGDSILSIRMIAQAHQSGLHLTPRQLFQYQTVAELAMVASAVEAPPAEQGEVSGPVPLTPIQHWFFEQDLPSPHHWNHAVLLETRPDLDPHRLGEAFDRLVAHHDGLRLRFHRGPDGWRQENAPLERAAFSWIELPPPSAASERQRAFQEAVAVAQAGLDLSRGPVLRAVFFGQGEGAPGRLLVVSHHLVIDGISWRLLLEDLQTAYGQLAAGAPVQLPPKTTSFQRWAERLVEEACSPETQAELPFWLAQGRGAARLPLDYPAGANLEGGVRTVAVWLDAAETQALLQRVPEAYRTRVDDALLTALIQGFAAWTGDRSLLVDLEGHGREEVGEYLNISRTTGWFATFAPVLLSLAGTGGPGEALKAIKEQLRAIPRRGIGYGLLRYLGPDREAARQLHLLPQPEVSFNYLGQLDQVLAQDGLLRPAGESAGTARDPRQLRRYLLDVSGDVSGGRLRLLWTYPGEILAETTVERLAQGCLIALRDIVAHCTTPEAAGCTPSDFPLASLSQAELDHLAGAEAREIEDLLPLSPLQQGLLFHTLEAPESAMYLLQFYCTLVGDLDPVAFGSAWQQVVDRHGILRSSFFWEGLEEPLQRSLRHVDLPFDWQDWRHLDEVERRERYERFIMEDRGRRFDLSRPPLMRITVVRFGEREHRLVWSYHHLLLDAWSAAIIVGEVFTFYAALRDGATLHLAPARPYGEYIAWLRRQSLAEAEGFWRQSLAGFGAPTPLSLDRQATTEPGGESGQAAASLTLSRAATDRLRAMARRHRLTLNTLVLGAWSFLLSYYSGEQDIVVGVISSGREVDLPGVDTIVGVFINTLPLRLEIDMAAPLASWLDQVQARQVEIRRFEHTPLVQVQQWSEVERGRPLFESIFVFENHPAGSGVSRAQVGLEVRDFRSLARTSYPLSLLANPGDEVSVELSYDRDRFDADAVERILGHLRATLSRWPDQAGEPLGRLSPLTGEERAEALAAAWPAPAPEERFCLHELFEWQVQRSPEATALCCEGRELTYEELDRRANRLAHHLIALGAAPERPVAILLERSLDLVVAILGVLKTGAPYLPIDPMQPPERATFMLADAGAGHLVTRGSLAAPLLPLAVEVIDLDATGEALAGRPETSPGWRISPANLAYVIYTSGSTGTPKGALLTHHNVVRLFTTTRDLYRFDASDVWTLFHSYAFDFSVWEMWGAFLFGGRLVVVPYAVSRSPEDYYRLLVEEKVTVLNQTPSAFRRLAEVDEESGAPLSLRWIVFGGEALAPDSLAAWVARHGEERPRAVNMYGITETTVHVTFRALTTADTVGVGHSPIGVSIPDLRLHLLNAWMQPVPVGAIGELYVGGPGLGRGYLGRADLTAQRFVPDPFSSVPGERLYKSGDLARRLPAGELDYLGRSDHQIKVRGFRVEPGEIEAALRRHSGVRHAVVLGRDDLDGDRRLVAYVVPTAPVITVGELREFLLQSLPEHMVPSAFVLLDALPLNASGKVDRRALPAPDRRPDLGDGYVAPRNPVEELMAAIWAEVLGLERVGIRDELLELGGHSLLATRLVARLRKQFEVELSLRELFDQPTVESLAAVVERARTAGETDIAPPITRARRGGDLPLSFAQQRLWFLDRWLGATPLFNVPFTVELRGRLHVPALAGTFGEIVRRHEALRTTFPEHRGVPIQAIAAPAPVPLPLVDLGALPAGRREGEAERLAAEESRRPFDLAAGPLLRAGLLRLAEEEHRLLATLHHIVCDGWSIGVLLREVTELYPALVEGRAPRLRELPVQYADFAVWQRDWLQGATLERQLAYWRQRLTGAPTRPALPTDRPRPELQTHCGGVLPISLTAEQTERLKSASRRFGVTLFMTTVALFKVLLRHVTGRNDVLVGTDVANRERLETEGLIGFFVNQLALRTDLSGDLALPELLRRVREVSLGAYSHKDLPFDKLVDALDIERSLGYSPLFQVKIFFVDPQEEGLALPELTVQRLGSENGTAKLDLTLALQDTPQGLRGSLEHNRDLFEDATAERWAAQLHALLAAFAERPEGRVEDLDRVLRDMERKETVMEKNVRQPASFDPFKSIKPKAIHLGRGEVVKKDYLAPGQNLPLVIQPAVAEADAVEWASTHREEIEKDLLRHGAILFRGFDLGSADTFERFASAICSELFNENGEHPRESVSGNVYTPVFYPPDQKLLWHNENSFNLRWPMKILFCAARPADEGGETPIVDSRKVFDDLDPGIRQRFVEKQVLYQRSFGLGVGLDWQTVFQTDDKDDLARRAAEEKIELEWQADGHLRTRFRRPAAARHPVTGEWIWFNQAQHWHVSCLEPETRRSMESLFAEDDLPRNCYYGDGSPIPDAEMAHILEVYQRHEISFPWQKGDVLLLDNMLVAHARNPFRGERRLLVALGEMKDYGEAQTGGSNGD